jgi:hypothetical protein
MRKWRWLTVLALLAATGYVASYPMAYRVLVGSDLDFSRRATVSSFIGPNFSGCWACQPSQAAIEKWNKWQFLRRFYFPPVEWMIDHTALMRPMLIWASVWDVDRQLAGDHLSRET